MNQLKEKAIRMAADILIPVGERDEFIARIYAGFEAMDQLRVTIEDARERIILTEQVVLDIQRKLSDSTQQQSATTEAVEEVAETVEEVAVITGEIADNTDSLVADQTRE